MGTVIKYIVYILIIIAVYIIGKGLYTGSITSSTTVGSVVTQVDDGTKNIAEDAVNVIEKTVDDVTQTHQRQ